MNTDTKSAMDLPQMADADADRAIQNAPEGMEWAILLNDGNFTYHTDSWDVKTTCQTPDMVSLAYIGSGDRD
jgi:hypothetical protein